MASSGEDMTPGRRRADHILLVLHDLANGGSELVAIRLANLWAAQGRRVTILSGVADGPARAHVMPGIEVVSLVPEIPRGLLSRERMGRAAAPVVRALAPDVIVGLANFQVPILGALKARLGRDAPPLVAKLSNPVTRPGRSAIGQYVYSRRMRLASRGITRIVALAPALADEARAVLARDTVSVLPNPNLADDWTPDAAGPRTKTILCAGRMAPQKRFALALEAFACLDADYRLVMVGDGPERAELEARVVSLGLSGRVSMPGFVPSILPYLREADALLVSARYEGYPNVIVEALSQGVPVATTPCTKAIGDIMADDSFGRIAPAEGAALGAALRQVLDGPGPDRDAVWRVFEGRRETVAASAWLELLDGVVADHRA